MRVISSINGLVKAASAKLQINLPKSLSGFMSTFQKGLSTFQQGLSTFQERFIRILLVEESPSSF
jgi:hypothetical protein